MKTELRILLTSLLILSTGLLAISQDDKLKHYQLDSLLEAQQESERPWLGFFRNEQLTTGLYVLETGTEDKQSPHDKDEIYYVIEGLGEFECNDELVKIGEGSILYVPAHADHRFLNISEKLVLLVFFD